VKQTFLKLDSVSFWTLPELAASARRAGLSADRYELQYNVLLSRPILLLAMVLIAANVSLRFSRSRDLGRMIISGVGVGFMLYVVMTIAWNLGSGGIVSPPLAAWLPAIVATLVGATVLLHLEDG
jgi:lipopolysaccharide export system permease protein